MFVQKHEDTLSRRGKWHNVLSDLAFTTLTRNTRDWVRFPIQALNIQRFQLPVKKNTKWTAVKCYEIKYFTEPIHFYILQGIAVDIRWSEAENKII